MRFFVVTKSQATRGALKASQAPSSKPNRADRGAPRHQFDPDFPVELFQAFGVKVLPKPKGRKSKIK